MSLVVHPLLCQSPHWLHQEHWGPRLGLSVVELLMQEHEGPQVGFFL